MYMPIMDKLGQVAVSVVIIFVARSISSFRLCSVEMDLKGIGRVEGD